MSRRGSLADEESPSSSSSSEPGNGPEIVLQELLPSATATAAAKKSSEKDPRRKSGNEAKEEEEEEKNLLSENGISKPIFPPENDVDDDDNDDYDPLDGDDDEGRRINKTSDDDDDDDDDLFCKKQRLTRDEVQDMQEVLEHIMVVGNHYRHLQWQCREHSHRTAAPTVAVAQPVDDSSAHSAKAAAVAATTTVAVLSRGCKHGRVETEGEGKRYGDSSSSRQRRKRDAGQEEPGKSSNDSFCRKNSSSSSSSSDSDDDADKEAENAMNKSNKMKKKKKHHLFLDIHAEDLKIYGDADYNFMEGCAWPRQSYRGIAQIKRVQKRDQTWCRIYGDDHVGDNPQNRVAFVTHRLSNQPPHQLPPGSSSATFAATTTSSARGNGDDNDATMAADEEAETWPQSTFVQSLLQHCWERAVHAASNSIVVNVSNTPKQEPSSNRVVVSTPPPPPPPPMPLSSPIGAADFCRSKRESLKISCPLEKETQDPSSSSSSSSSWMCSVCQVNFDSREQLDEHFYGTNGQLEQQQGEEEPREKEQQAEPSTWPKLLGRRGCCWTLIERRRVALLDQVLQTEVEVQTKLLARFLMNSTIRERGHGQNTTELSRMAQIAKGDAGNSDVDNDNNMTEATKTPLSRNKQPAQRARSQEAARASMPHMDHQHVLAVFSDSLSKAKQEGSTARQHRDSNISKIEKLLMETVLVEPKMPPLLLNPTILQTVKSRCIQRYGRIAK
jgi:hypothetical protein